MVIIASKICQSGKSGAKSSTGAGDRREILKSAIGKVHVLVPATVFHRQIKKNLWLGYGKVKQSHLPGAKIGENPPLSTGNEKAKLKGGALLCKSCGNSSAVSTIFEKFLDYLCNNVV
ncbi:MULTISPECIES: hypothetical protein [unclassified Synechocystis]|uniref:hypothetical protein n=1 Tax=unclassified Synechocystis TaxID=2640012 RepID=UPI00048CE267|nr:MULTISPECIES: hypothetical protein [unclassified Synechocystis]AIE73700.1 hypothetical protein D082_11720 [Synechocystis sp. PCC 6714]MCT0252261.1 hypothetical protein [Synechocystis sp. CS-94]